MLLRLAALLLLTSCGGVDSEQSALCRRLIPAFDAGPVEVLRAEPAADHGVVLHYRAGGAERWIACRFQGGFFDGGRHALAAVATDREGWLSAMPFTMLRIWAGLPPPGARSVSAAAPDAASPWLPVLYLAQQAVNAATLACVYGLLAIGYTLVFGILGQLNLAMGELTMIGAMVAAMGATGFALAGAGLLPLALLAVLAVGMAVSASYGWAMDRVLFRPLRGVRTHTPLIVAVGGSIALQEAVRLLHGAGDWWPMPVYATTHVLAETPGFAVTAVTGQGLVVALTLVLYAILWQVMRRTPFGRAYRAASDDVEAAALVGLDVDRTVAWTFVVGGAYAGAAGVVIALYYGGVNFFTGYLVGFKALTAAVIGGIGSVPGAMLGGVVLGLFETVWSGYFTLAYKDVVAFGLLALFLLFRPDGLLGERRSRGD